MSSIGTTIVVEFGEGADSSAFVAVELDETLNKNADGSEKSQWYPGDQVWFWLQYDEAVLRLDRIVSTSGMVVAAGEVSRTREQALTWTVADDPVELSHQPSGPVSLHYYGRAGTGMRQEGRQIRMAGGVPCTADATLPLRVLLYRYVPPPMTLAEDQTWRSVIVVYLEAAT